MGGTVGGYNNLESAGLSSVSAIRTAVVPHDVQIASIVALPSVQKQEEKKEEMEEGEGKKKEGAIFVDGRAVSLSEVADIQTLAKGVHARLITRLDLLSELVGKIGADKMNHISPSATTTKMAENEGKTMS